MCRHLLWISCEVEYVASDFPPPYRLLFILSPIATSATSPVTSSGVFVALTPAPLRFPKPIPFILTLEPAMISSVGRDLIRTASQAMVWVELKFSLRKFCRRGRFWSRKLRGGGDLHCSPHPSSHGALRNTFVSLL
ncbi:hypothetical protein U1Q18_007614 [Sarracenia purpurea var. burkii]